MKIQELIEITEKLESRNNNYWNFYTVVIVAVCGWVITSDTNLSSLEKTALMIGNGLFYFMNLSVIYGTTSRIVAFEKELIHVAGSATELTPALRQHLSKPMLEYRLEFTVATHLIMDVAVLVFLYFGIG